MLGMYNPLRVLSVCLGRQLAPISDSPLPVLADFILEGTPRESSPTSKSDKEDEDDDEKHAGDRFMPIFLVQLTTIVFYCYFIYVLLIEYMFTYFL